MDDNLQEIEAILDGIDKQQELVVNDESVDDGVKPLFQNYLKQQELLQSQLDKDAFHEERQQQQKQHHRQVKSEKIYVYFCSICGKKSIMANVGLDSLPNRRADNSIAVSMTQIFLQTFLVQEGVKYIKRPNSNEFNFDCVFQFQLFNCDQLDVEKQYRWKCEECGVFIAYQCISYEESSQILSLKEGQLSNRPYLYVLNDALVINQQFSKLFQEVARLKDQLLP